MAVEERLGAESKTVWYVVPQMRALYPHTSQKLVRVSNTRAIEEVCEYELEAGEDAPMSIAANLKV